MDERISVLLVDDHALVRRGFHRLLDDEPDLRVIGEAGTGAEAISLAEQARPRVVVMDYSLPDMTGVDALKLIRTRQPETVVVMLSMHDEENYRRQAREAGARGYLLKNAVDVDLAEAIRVVATGRRYDAHDEADPPLEQRGEPDLDKLTPREKQVLTLLAQGNSSKEIAAILGVSKNTVGVHRTNLMSALNIHRTAELVVFAVKHGLVTP